jgi:hypothetical protein
MNVAVKPAELVEEYIHLRDLKAKAKETFAEFCHVNYNERMDAIEGELLNLLNAMGVDSLAGKTGTAYKNISTSVTIADAREFRRHVIGTEGWDLIDWRANKTAVNELVEQGEPVPPGVNRTAIYTIGIRRKS